MQRNERPVVESGQVILKPVMCVALAQDHIIVDGRESVQYLVKVKGLVEYPAAMMLE
jgi:2-oxoglutarate dehydrogenase E2 component (dihydrolipoamide succinyltransferase)